MKKVLCLLAAALFLPLIAGPIVRVNKIKDFSKVDWLEAVEMTGFIKPITLDYSKERTSLRLFHDGTYLYGKVDAVQKNAQKLSGSKQHDDAMLWKNNGVELFFGSHPKQLKQVMINLEGTICDIAYKNGKADFSWNGCEVLAREKTANHWSVTFRIPLKELPVSRKNTLNFNIVRDNYEKQDFSSWSPLTEHFWAQPKKFGTLQLDDDDTKRCGVTFDALPVVKPEGKVFITLHASSALPARVNLYTGNYGRRKNVQLKAGNNSLQLPYTSPVGNHKQIVSISANGKLLSYTGHETRGEFLEVYALKEYAVSSAEDLPTQIFWRGVHSMEGDLSCGNRVLTDYEILFDLPQGVYIQGIKKSTPSPRGNGRVIVSVPQNKAYCAPNWISTPIWSNLPEGSTGTVYYRVKWKNFLQKEESFTFKVYGIKPVETLKKMTVGFYNFYPRRLSDAEKVRKYGINTIFYSRQDAGFSRELLKNGFYVVRGGYFFPGGTYAFREWTKVDPSAAAMSIDKKVITGNGNAPQISPSYRGKYFMDAVKKEREFALKAGISHFAFDMEGYIMPNGKAACFRPETIAGFEKWMKEFHPEKKYISPFVFEREPEKYPEYHRLWGDFKDWLFAGFFKEFKKQMALPASIQSVPWKGISISEWSLSLSDDPENVHDRMRGREFLKTFDLFELSSYTSADRGVRQHLYYLELARRIYPDVKLQIIGCPSPERLDRDNRNPEEYYYSPAPMLEDELKYKIFDSAACGAKGIHIWSFPQMNARAWKNLTEAIRALKRVEHICVDGTFRTDLSCDQTFGLLDKVELFNRKKVLKNQPKILVKGMKLGKESLLAVSEYFDLKPVNVKVHCPVQKKAEVFDCETGRKIAEILPGKNVFYVQLDSRRCRLLHVIEK